MGHHTIGFSQITTMHLWHLHKQTCTCKPHNKCYKNLKTTCSVLKQYWLYNTSANAMASWMEIYLWIHFNIPPQSSSISNKPFQQQTIIVTNLRSKQLKHIFFCNTNWNISWSSMITKTCLWFNGLNMPSFFTADSGIYIQHNLQKAIMIVQLFKNADNTHL